MDEIQNNTDFQFDSLVIKEISAIFRRIDEQLIDLLNCSSEDFLNLNADFKKYYKNAKTISENANEIFGFLSQKNNIEPLNKLQLIYKDLKLFSNCINEYLESSIKKIHLTHLTLDHLFLPIKNINQDLMTLRFLMANLKLSSESYLQQNSIEFIQNAIRQNELIDSLILFGYENEKKDTIN